jgi:hypothetical protein
MNELVPEAGVGLGIKDFLEPIDDDFVSVGITKFLVIGQPEVGVMADAEIDRKPTPAPLSTA